MSKTEEIFPVMGTDIPVDAFFRIDLSAEATAGKVTDPLVTMGEFIQSKCSEEKYCPYGGFLEKRGFYTADQYTRGKQMVRDLHIGVDIWLSAGTPVYAPLDGKIHSFAYNDKPLDYGGTIILEHEWKGMHFYALYGHVSKNSVQGLKSGAFISKGRQIAELGSPEENGGWYPHLHLQIIKNMGRFSGDYPGVVAEKNINVIENCENAEFLVLPV
ncbi:MAG: peptidase M23 [Saprospirales bacterium]|nr:MAG: peptidase M23 [Saprospirales bacterium]